MIKLLLAFILGYSLATYSYAQSEETSVSWSVVKKLSMEDIMEIVVEAAQDIEVTPISKEPEQVSIFRDSNHNWNNITNRK